jgi:hypothetical protein
MRRLAAALAFFSLLQSAMLSTGVLCEGAESSSASMLPMPEMTDSGAHGAHGDPRRRESMPPSDRDRHHEGAHCPLMAGCIAMAVRVPSLEIRILQRSTISLPIAPVIAPHSERIAPEPPPPKG